MKQPNNEKHVQVRADDLPLHCPTPGSPLWSSHPRVYIPLEGDSESSCPYCGTVYTLSQNAQAGDQQAEDNKDQG